MRNEAPTRPEPKSPTYSEERKQIDLSALARLMLKYEEKWKRLREIEKAIEDTILQIEETQIVGNVSAKYSKGRKNYLYEKAVKENEVPEHIISNHTTLKTYTSWSKVCEEAEIDKENIEYTQSGPTVKIKVKEN